MSTVLDRVWALSPSAPQHIHSSALAAGWHHVGGAAYGCGGCVVGHCAPALWIWGSTVHWSSTTLLSHRLWIVTRCPPSILCESLPFPTAYCPAPPCLESPSSLFTSLCSYVCSRSGHIIEIDPQRMAVRRTRRLLPTGVPSDFLLRKQSFSAGRGACSRGKWLHLEALMPMLPRPWHRHQQPQHLSDYMCGGL